MIARILKESYAKDQAGGNNEEAGGSYEVTTDKTRCLQVWRQVELMPLDKQADVERAL